MIEQNFDILIEIKKKIKGKFLFSRNFCIQNYWTDEIFLQVFFWLKKRISAL